MTQTLDHPDAHAIRDAMERAGAAAMARLRDRKVRVKDDGSKVTDADLAANEILVTFLADRFPHDRILSEESDPIGPEHAAHTWYVDPIDGTSVFTEGLAHWGPVVSRATGSRFDLGAFWQPRVREFFFATPGSGAWQNGRQIAPPSPHDDIRQHVVFVPSGAHHLPSLPWRGKTRSLGSTAAHLAYVATGGAVAAVIPAWNPWDVGCGLVMAAATQRAVVDLSGAPFDPMSSPGAPFMVADAVALDPLVAALRTALDSRPDS